MITKTEFKNFVGLSLNTYDTAIDQIIAGVKLFVENHCQNVLNLADVEDIFDGDEIDKEGNAFLSSRINVTNIKVYNNTGTEQTPQWTETTNFTSYPLSGFIKLQSHAEMFKCVKITYKSGYTDITAPADLKLACLKIASAFFNKRKAEGQGSVGLDGASISFAGSVNDEIKQLLSKYKSINL